MEETVNKAPMKIQFYLFQHIQKAKVEDILEH